jgi:hypothetical protein
MKVPLSAGGPAGELTSFILEYLNPAGQGLVDELARLAS